MLLWVALTLLIIEGTKAQGEGTGITIPQAILSNLAEIIAKFINVNETGGADTGIGQNTGYAQPPFQSVRPISQSVDSIAPSVHPVVQSSYANVYPQAGYSPPCQDSSCQSRYTRHRDNTCVSCDEGDCNDVILLVRLPNFCGGYLRNSSVDEYGRSSRRRGSFARPYPEYGAQRRDSHAIAGNAEPTVSTRAVSQQSSYSQTPVYQAQQGYVVPQQQHIPPKSNYLETQGYTPQPQTVYQVPPQLPASCQVVPEYSQCGVSFQRRNKRIPVEAEIVRTGSYRELKEALERGFFPVGPYIPGATTEPTTIDPSAIVIPTIVSARQRDQTKNASPQLMILCSLVSLSISLFIIQ